MEIRNLAATYLSDFDFLKEEEQGTRRHRPIYNLASRSTRKKQKLLHVSVTW